MSEREYPALGSRVTIQTLDQELKLVRYKGEIPHDGFGMLMPWLIADDGTGYHGYECWWGEIPEDDSAAANLNELLNKAKEQTSATESAEAGHAP